MSNDNKIGLVFIVLVSIVVIWIAIHFVVKYW